MKATEELDVLVLLMVVLTVLHASTRPFGMGVAVTAFLLALFVEEASIMAGGTHCHADATVMVAPCSSLNSVAYYASRPLLAHSPSVHAAQSLFVHVFAVVRPAEKPLARARHAKHNKRIAVTWVITQCCGVNKFMLVVIMCVCGHTIP